MVNHNYLWRLFFVDFVIHLTRTQSTPSNHDSYIALKTQHHSKFPNHRHMRFYIFLIIKIIYPLPCIIRYGVNIFYMWKNITLCACVPNNHNRNTDHFFFTNSEMNFREIKCFWQCTCVNISWCISREFCTGGSRSAAPDTPYNF